MKLVTIIRRFRVDRRKRFSLTHINPADICCLDINKGEARAIITGGIQQLTQRREMLYAYDRWAALAIFQASTRFCLAMMPMSAIDHQHHCQYPAASHSPPRAGTTRPSAQPPFVNFSVRLSIISCLALFAVISRAAAEDVGRFRNDWTGNSIVVEAIADPKVQGVTCHISRFSRSVIDRLSKGNWFADPSNSSIACQQTGPVTISEIDTSTSGEEVFSERLSLIFKSLAVRRIFDKKNTTLIYLIYSRQVKDASAKMGISTVPLYGRDVNWMGDKER